MKYRSVATAIWTDDAILELSPEQKLVLLYLHTNPYASACGIYQMPLKTMAFQIGMQQDSFESAVIGLCAKAPDFIQVDWQTKEVALLQYPKQTLIQASAATMKHVSQEIEKVKSQSLLRELIARNSATISKPYVAQLRRLQMQAINETKSDGSYGDVRNFTDNEVDMGEKEKEKEKEKEREKGAPAKIENLNFVDVAKQMEEYVTNGDGKRQWDAMAQAQGFTGKPITILMNWAGKASPYQLRNWKDEIPRLQSWMRNEARADLKAKPRPYTSPGDQPVPISPNTRVHKKKTTERWKPTPAEIEELRKTFEG